ncbi:MAG: serine hydrolase [Hyphomicrobium sp.]
MACAALLLGVSHPAEARGARHAAMMIDANSGAVLHNDNGDELRHPASLTKMMTLYLTFETIEAGRMTMKSPVKISQEAASVAPSKLDLDPGEEISAGDAIRALITKSANDVAVALAEKIGGTQANFVRLMNAKARELGMSKTNFENPSGLPDPDQVTTARDMITLGLALQDHFPQHYLLFATRSFSFGRATYRNHNTLMNSFAGIDGIKTGYTRASGFNLVSSVRRGGKHIVGAVFGGASAATRNGEMRVLLTRAIARGATTKTRRPVAPLIARLKGAPKLAVRAPAKAVPREKAAGQDIVAALAVAAPAAKPVPMPAPASLPSAAAGIPATKKIPAPLQAAAKALRPTAQPVTAARAVTPAAAPTAAPTATPAPAFAPAIEQPAAPTDAPSATDENDIAATAPAPVEVAKVRRVMVAPRTTQPTVDETTDMESADTPETIATARAPSLANLSPAARSIADLFSTPKNDPAAAVNETIVAKTAPTQVAMAEAISTGPAAPQSDALSGLMSRLGGPDVADVEQTPTKAAAPQAAATPETPSAADVPEPVRTASIAKATTTPARPTTPAAKPVSAAATKPATSAAKIASSASSPGKPAARVAAALPATPPSTFEAQASGLKGQPARAQRVASLTPTAVGAASADDAPDAAMPGRFEIQIGAYATVDDAQRALANANAKAGPVLANYASVTHPVNKAGRQIYRARYRGFDATSAAQTCQQLRKNGLDCFVMSAE